jgi:hypothetical protein
MELLEVRDIRRELPRVHHGRWQARKTDQSIVVLVVFRLPLIGVGVK